MSNRNYVYPAKDMIQHRNKFKIPHQHKTSFQHGQLVPLDIIEVLPGDTLKFDLATLIRMSTPIAPIMDNITMHTAAYFIPLRLIFENFEQVMGANKTGAWTQDPTIYSIPYYSGAYGGGPFSLGNYFSLDVQRNVSVLPGRAYYLVWNEFYRNQNVSAPYPVDLSSNNDILVGELSNTYAGDLLPLGKYSDYFTKCLPEPQKGQDVLIPMLDLPVLTGPAHDTTSTNLFWNVTSTGQQVTSNGLLGVAGNGLTYKATTTGSTSELVVPNNLYANNVSNSINALRFAFQLQKFYEKDARYGTRYFEMLNGHYGVSNPDLVLSRPEFLGEYNFRINIDQVLSTAGYSATSSTTVGAPGANSVTAKKGALFTKSFTEHGYVLVVGGTRHEHTYPFAIPKLFRRFDRLDFYDPLFANIGEQPVYKNELVPDVSNPGWNNSVFGYQEAWAEYRFLPDRVTSYMNPQMSGSLDFWTLADKFATNLAPSLSGSFVYENRSALSRALVTGATGPDFIADFYFDVTAVRPMPLFSIPGLADHH